MARYSRKELMARVRTSIQELHLSSMTLADKKRLAYVEQGLFALDEEQALLKTGIEELLEEHKDSLLSAMTPGLDRFIGGLKELVSDNLPRVHYPDKKLIEGGRREIPLSGPAPSKSTVRQLKNVQENLGKIPKTKAKVK